MDVTQLPFNRLIGLESAAESGLLITLPAGSQYANHLGTVHASALLAVAEAGSGAFLAGRLDAAGLVPVVRRLEARFRRPATGRVSARATVPDEEVIRWASELETRGRVLAAVPVEGWMLPGWWCCPRPWNGTSPGPPGIQQQTQRLDPSPPAVSPSLHQSLVLGQPQPTEVGFPLCSREFTRPLYGQTAV